MTMTTITTKTVSAGKWKDEKLGWTESNGDLRRLDLYGMHFTIDEMKLGWIVNSERAISSIEWYITIRLPV